MSCQLIQPLSIYDYISLLCVDYRHYSLGKINERLQSKGIDSMNIHPFIDGQGAILPLFMYNQLSPPPPKTWQHGAPAYSHFSAMKKIIENAMAKGAKTLLFTEDDVIFTDDFDRLVVSIHNQLPDDWDMFYYGANHSSAKTKQISENILRVFDSRCTHCVAIKNTMFEPILALPADVTIDMNIGQRLHPHFNCYAAWPAIALQEPNYSYLWYRPVDYTDLFSSKGEEIQ